MFFYKKILIFLAVFMCFSLPEMIFADVTFEGGKEVLITGSGADVRFDVGNEVFGPPTAGVGYPLYNTTTGLFSGAFYINGIGWGTFSTGSYQVAMYDCMKTKISCPFSGTGWSDTIGEIGFADVSYSPITGKINGKIHTFAGDYDMSSMYLSIDHVRIRDQNDPIHYPTNSRTEIILENAEQYTGKIVTLSVSIDGLPNYKREYPANNGVFSSVDLSIANKHTTFIIEIKNPLLGNMIEGTTTFTDVIVSASQSSTTLQGGNSLISQLCQSTPNSSYCPDGSERSATAIIAKDNITRVLADGSSSVRYTLKLRDAYGNRLSAGKVKINYRATLRQNQVDVTENMFLRQGFPGDAIVSTKIWADLFGNASSNTIEYDGITDITYDIASYAPTTENNTISLENVKYNDRPISMIQNENPNFIKPWEATIGSGGVIYTITAHDFPVNITRNGEHDIVPEIIGRLFLEADFDPTNSVNTFWRIVHSPDTFSCVRYGASVTNNENCNWMTSGTFFAKNTTENFDVRAFYNTLFPKQTLNTIAETYVHYTLDGRDIIYKSSSEKYGADAGDIVPLRILGQTSADVTDAAIIRTEFFNSIRKNISLLKRNTSDYASIPYLIETDHTFAVNESSIMGKRSIIGYGQDIVIDGNISQSDTPRAIISLAIDGKGGNIIIDESVTDIHASLIAERGIVGSGAADHQLYIYGSLISTNTYSPDQCPYFLAGADPERCDTYNISNLRKDFDNFDESKRSLNSVAREAAYTPVVIQTDNRLLMDPPPGLETFYE